MQKIEQNGYTREQIINVLHGLNTSRKIKFRYDLLNKNEVKIGELDKIEPGGEIRFDKDADIKKSIHFRIRDEGNIDWLNDRIQPFFMLQMPDNNWVEWSLGIFLMPSPDEEEKAGKKYRPIDGLDGLYILTDDKFDYRLYLKKGTNYVQNIKNILAGAGITKMNIEASDEVLLADRVWDPGTTKLAVINALLKDITFTQLWVDEWGVYTSSRYKLPQERASEYSYRHGEISVIFPGVKRSKDMYHVPNKWTVTVSNSSSAAMTSAYINENSASPTSTVSRGRIIPVYKTINYISSKAALDQYVKMLANNDSQINDIVTATTAIMPFHGYNDVVDMYYPPLGIDGKYEELSWVIPMIGGGKMRHEIRQVISI